MTALALLSCNDGGNVSAEHYPLTIESDVQTWMEEQLASKSDEKRRILIIDMSSAECRKNLYIPGEILSENCKLWIVLMTAEELAKLSSKKYDNLAIAFYYDIEPLKYPGGYPSL